MRYLVQFPAGLGPLVDRALAHGSAGYRQVYADDSALVFDTTRPIETADDVPVAKNVFVVWATAPRRAGAGGLDRSVHRLADRVPPAIRPKRPDRAGFRTMVHLDGQLTGVDRTARNRLEGALAARTGQRVQARGGNTEYWVMGRRDHDELWLLQRLPRRGKQAKPAAGALAPELAAAMVLASDPRPGEVFCDPFAGSGALVLARAAYPAKTLICNDLEPDRRSPVPGDHRVRMLHEDALTLPSVGDGSVDAIVTDPPWGEHAELDRPYPEFAAAYASTFRRVLRDTPERTGRLVLLTSRRTEDLVAAACEDAALPIADRLPILVNGHPASVLTGAPLTS